MGQTDHLNMTNLSSQEVKSFSSMGYLLMGAGSLRENRSPPDAHEGEAEFQEERERGCGPGKNPIIAFSPFGLMCQHLRPAVYYLSLDSEFRNQEV